MYCFNAQFTAQFDIAVSDRYSYEKMHTESLVWRDGLTPALVTTYTTFFISEIQTGAILNVLVLLNNFIFVYYILYLVMNIMNILCEQNFR